MAKKSVGAKAQVQVWRPRSRKSRPGVHAKTKHDWSKSGKHWAKAYRGQGR